MRTRELVRRERHCRLLRWCIVIAAFVKEVFCWNAKQDDGRVQKMFLILVLIAVTFKQLQEGAGLCNFLPRDIVNIPTFYRLPEIYCMYTCSVCDTG